MRMFSSAGFLLRKHRAIVIWFAALLGISGLTWWLGTQVQSPGEAFVEAEPPARVPILAPVDQRVLTRKLVFPGTVRARQEWTIDLPAPPGEGLPLVTAPPPEPGDKLREGDRLVEVSGRPVLALAGVRPMYRDLHRGMEGEDIAQLQDALTRLGYGTGGTGGVFGPDTATAVEQFYADRGYEAPTRLVTTPPAPGSRVPGPEVGPEAQGATGRGGGPVGEGSSVRNSSEESDAGVRLQVIVPYNEIRYLPELPVRVTKASTAVGNEPHDPLMKVASGGLVVESLIPTSRGGTIEPGDDVSVAVTSGGGEFSGKVTGVSTRGGGGGGSADGSGGSGKGPGGTRVVRIAGDKPIEPDLEGENVSVTLRLGSTGEEALVVPVSAVWSRPDGRSYVSVRTSPGGGTRRVAVQVGLTADGYAALTHVSGRLRPGDRVVVGKERR